MGDSAGVRGLTRFNWLADVGLYKDVTTRGAAMTVVGTAETRAAALSPGRMARSPVAQVVIVSLATALWSRFPYGAVVGGEFGPKLLYLAAMGGLLAICAGFLRARKLAWSDVGLRRPQWIRTAIAVPVGGLVAFTAAWGAGAAMSRLGLHHPDFTKIDFIRHNTVMYLFMLIPVSWGTAAFGEELIFRGFILRSLLDVSDRRTWIVAALVLQATLFGVLHLYQGAGGAVVEGVVGLVLGAVWLLTGRNLWACIILHGLTDSLAMTAIYLGG